MLKVEWMSINHLQEALKDIDAALNLQVACSEQLAVEVIVVCELETSWKAERLKWVAVISCFVASLKAYQPAYRKPWS